MPLYRALWGKHYGMIHLLLYLDRTHLEKHLAKFRVTFSRENENSLFAKLSRLGPTALIKDKGTLHDRQTI